MTKEVFTLADGIRFIEKIQGDLIPEIKKYAEICMENTNFDPSPSVDETSIVSL